MVASRLVVVFSLTDVLNTIVVDPSTPFRRFLELSRKPPETQGSSTSREAP